MSLQTVRLGELLDSALTLSQEAASRHKVRLLDGYKHLGKLRLRTDPLRLRQVMLNLLSNAIKYNKPNGTVELRAERRPGQLDLVVEDTGIGMTSQQLNQIFQPFNRLGRERSGIEGTGIGMAISGQLVELLEGSLQVDSVPEQGTVARVSLPYLEPEDDGTPEPDGTWPPAAAMTQPRGTVLYIEDNPVNALLVEQVLQGWKEVKFLLAEDGRSGIEMALNELPDLVLLDMQLPDMTGFEVLRELRGDERARSLRVVALSASAMGEDVEAARSAGADDYWTKPIDAQPFLESVWRVLSRARETTRR